MTEREMARRNAARKARARKARNRRVLLTAVLMLAVCVVSIGGTIAWLTDKTGTVTNTFSPSDINITLTETGVTLDDNKDGSKSLDMVPGNVIAKDPTVTITAGSEPCYVFVKVNEGGNVANYISYDIAAGWTQYPNVEGVYYRTAGSIANDGTVTLVGNDASYPVIGYTDDKGTDATEDDVFVANKVLVKTTVNKAAMEALMGETATLPSLSFKAAAVQMANMTLDAAYAEVASFLNPTTTSGN